MADEKDMFVKLYIQPIIESIEDIGEPIVDVFKKSTKEMKDGMQEIAEDFEKVFENWNRGLKDTIRTLKDIPGAIGTGIQSFVTDIKKEGVGDAVVNSLTKINLELVAIAGLLTLVLGALNAFLGPISDTVGKMLEVIFLPFKILGVMLSAQLIPFLDIAIVASSLLANWLIGILGGEEKGTQVTGEGIVEPSIIDVAIEDIITVFEAFVIVLDTVANVLRPILFPILEFNWDELNLIFSGLLRGLHAIVEIFAGAWDALTSFTQDEKIEAFLGGAVRFTEGIANFVSGVWDDISAFIDKYNLVDFEGIKKDFEDAWNSISSFFMDIINYFTNLDVDTELGKITTAFDSFVQGIVDWFNSWSPIKIGEEQPTSLPNKGESGGILDDFIKGVGETFSGFLSLIPPIASGGYIEQSGLAVVHRGETVVPAGYDSKEFADAVNGLKSDGIYPLISAINDLTKATEESSRGTVVMGNRERLGALGPQTSM